MRVLVAGGAGYIGSHNVRLLLERGHEAVVVDNLRTGHREAVPGHAPFYEADIRDKAALDEIFEKERIDAVLHFAASSQVGESMEQPIAYFDNNVGGMLVLLESMRGHGVDKIVFSSSAAVYGNPDSLPIPEDAPLRPANPYGDTKLFMEKIMSWTAAAHGMRFVSLRYFNVAGAWPGGDIGEDHRPETHLVPIILQAALGKRKSIKVFGTDYPTPDGSCIRDYIDVMDLADAHMRALDWLEKGGQTLTCNLGNGEGFSVMEMIGAAREATGAEIPIEISGRRAGDPAMLVASSRLAKSALGWEPTRKIGAIIASAWEWHKKHPEGY